MFVDDDEDDDDDEDEEEIAGKVPPASKTMQLPPKINNPKPVTSSPKTQPKA